MTPPDGYESYRDRAERKRWATVRLLALASSAAISMGLCYAVLRWLLG